MGKTKPAKQVTESTPTSTVEQEPSQKPPAPANPALQKLLNASKTVTIHRSQIQTAKYNPRVMSPSARKKLSQSLARFGLVGSLVWNVRTGNLVGGHQRLAEIDRVAKSLDYELEVSRIDVDDKTERAINLALNNTDLQGQYDHDLLADIASDLCEHDQSLLDAAGFDEKSLHVILGDEFTPSWARQQADLEAPIVETLNDIYETGRSAEKSKTGARPSTSPQDAEESEADADDEPDHDQDDSDDTPQDSHEAEDESDEDLRESLAGKRKVYKAATTEEDNADVLLTIHAPNTAAIERLLALLGQEPGERYLPISALFDALK